MRIRACAIVAAVVVPVVMSPTAGYATTLSNEQAIVVKAGDQYDPAVWGPLVSYTDTSSGNADIWYWDAFTRSSHIVATGPADQVMSSIWGNSVVYVDHSTGYGDIKLYDVLTGLTTNLTNTLNRDETEPTISYRLIAWTSGGSSTLQVHVRDRLLGTEVSLSGTQDQFRPSASGPRVAYVAGQSIRVYDADTGTSSLVVNGPADSPSIDGSHIVLTEFSSSADVAVYDVAGNRLAGLALPGDQGNAHISGNWVSFEDYSSGLPHVGLWHWTTGEVFYPAPSTSNQLLNDISGDRVVYADDRSGDLDLYSYESPDLLLK